MIESDTFRSLLSRFPSGITIITARDGDRDVGMTASAFCSVSLWPPLVLVCVDRNASMHDLLLAHPDLGINILSSDQEASSRRFASKRDTNRFEGLGFSRGESAVVLLDDASAQLEARVVCHHDAGDHTIFIAAVERGALIERQPLLYYRGSYARLERSRPVAPLAPLNAPAPVAASQARLERPDRTTVASAAPE
ncbi:MAG TPA: flavin reductase family protein [Gemmatimonadaceae bacterium]|nr:flavin reductase family protein [Gemmatimonadaceae bacterium]